jgi:hypothetical protein
MKSVWALTACLDFVGAVVHLNAPQIKLTVDHATYCASDLAIAQSKFRDLGLPPRFGGAHSSVTHMALIGFRDGSYLELVAPQEPQRAIPPQQKWRELMLDDAGPCAWTVKVPEVGAEVKRLTALNLTVAGPLPGSRKKPDGKVLLWETGFVRPGDPGSMLPFFIGDKTPRRWRVAPSKDLLGSGLVGLSKVVIAVKDLEQCVAKFRLAYGLPAPEMYTDVAISARTAWFESSPVVLAAPMEATGWLSERIAKYGDRPAAFLLGTDSLEDSVKKFALRSPMRLAGKSIAWFSPSVLGGMRVGVIEE